jgi:putative transposase
VILPDHIHTIWKLPDNDFDYPSRWKAIKSLFTRLLVRSGERLVKNTRGEYLLWQRRYWEHTITDTRDLQLHIDYIHYNPVKHGYVDSVTDWAHSSFHHYVQSGVLPDDWGGVNNSDEGMGFGE